MNINPNHFLKNTHIILIIISLLFINYSWSQDAYIEVSSEPFIAGYFLFSEDSSYTRMTTTVFGGYFPVPANHTYIVIWDNTTGYIAPSSSSTYLFADQSVNFHGIYLPDSISTAPSSLTAVPFTSSKVDLSWQDNSINEAGFIINRRIETDPFFQFNIVTTVSANQISYQDTGLSPSTEYEYYVQAVNSVGTSAQSNHVIVTTFTAAQAPIADFFCSMTSFFSVQTVWFIDNSQYAESWIWDFGDGEFSYTPNPFHLFFHATQSTTYQTKLIVTNSMGEDTASKFLTIGFAPDNLVVIATTNSVFGLHLEWQDKSVNDIGFEIYRREGALESFDYLTTVPMNIIQYDDFGSDTSIGLDSTVQYNYKVRAVSVDTVSDFTSIGTPYVVSEFYAWPTSGFAYFDQMTVYFGDYSLNAEEWYWDFGDGNTFIGQNPVSHTYTTPTNAIFYAQLSVYNSIGSGDTLTKAIFVSNPPSGLNASGVSSTQIQIGWLDNANYETGFEIWRQISSGPFSLYTSTPPDSSDFTDTGLSSGTEYGYRVRATTYQAVSEFTNDVTAQTTTPIQDWYLYDSGIMAKHIPGTMDGVLPNFLYRELIGK